MPSKHPGKVIVIAGPAGVGKNSIIRGVLTRCQNCTDLVTATTRAMRPGEEEGRDYFFMSEQKFDEQVQKGNIPEIQHHPTGVRYGTYLPFLWEHLKRGETVLGDINIVGAKYLKEQFGALCFFIEPPSFDALEKRIIARKGSMPAEELEKRLALAKKEITEEAPWYDYRIVNEEGKLNEAVDKVIEILRKERYINE